MADYTENFENGSAGVTISSSNTSFTGLSIAANSSSVFSADAAAEGSLGGVFQCAASEVNFAEWSGLSATQFAFRGYIEIPDATKANADGTTLFNPRHAGGNICQLRQQLNGTLRMVNSAGSTITTSGVIPNSQNPIVTGPIVVEGVIDVGTTTSNGTLHWKWYIEGQDGVNDGIVAYDSGLQTGLNLGGGAALSNFRVGKPGSVGAITYRMDALALRTDTTSFIGPLDRSSIPEGWDEVRFFKKAVA